MTKQQLFNKITSQPKWYEGHYSQGYASQLVQRFKMDMLKESTLHRLFHKFGYKKLKDEDWG